TESGLDVEPRVLLGRRRPNGHGRGVRALCDDARERRRARRRQNPEPTHGGADGLSGDRGGLAGAQYGHASEPPARRGIRPRRQRGERPCRAAFDRLEGQLRLERLLRHVLLGRSAGEPRRAAHGADVRQRLVVRIRVGRDAGSGRLETPDAERLRTCAIARTEPSLLGSQRRNDMRWISAAWLPAVTISMLWAAVGAPPQALADDETAPLYTEADLR